MRHQTLHVSSISNVPQRRLCQEALLLVPQRSLDPAVSFVTRITTHVLAPHCSRPIRVIQKGNNSSPPCTHRFAKITFTYILKGDSLFRFWTSRNPIRTLGIVSSRSNMAIVPTTPFRSSVNPHHHRHHCRFVGRQH